MATIKDLFEDTFFAMTRTGATYRVEPAGTVRLVANPERILADASSSQSFKVKKAFQASGLDVDLSIKRNQTLAYCTLKKLPLATRFAVQNGHYVPVFVGNDSATFMLNISWVPPTDMRIKFGFDIALDEDNRLRVNQAFLFATSTARQGYFKLPLPNLYDDGKICIGEAGLNARGDTIQELFEKQLRLLEVSTWNNDLISGADYASRVFQFTLDNCQTIQLPWVDYCRLVSRPELTEIAS